MVASILDLPRCERPGCGHGYVIHTADQGCINCGNGHHYWLSDETIQKWVDEHPEEMP